MPRRLPIVIRRRPARDPRASRLRWASTDGDLTPIDPALRTRWGQLPTRRALERDPAFGRHREAIGRFLGAVVVIGGRQPSSASVPAADESVRAVAWNIERGKAFDGVASALSEHRLLAHADLLLLTEVDLGMARSGNRHVASALADALGMHVAYANHHLVLSAGDLGERPGFDARAPDDVHNAVGGHGSALLSRFPIVRAASLPVGEFTDKFEVLETRLGTKRALFAEVAAPFGPLTVAVVHLDPFASPAFRARQMAAVQRGLEAFGAGERVLVGGDLNTTTWDLSSGAAVTRDAHRKLWRHGIVGTLEHYTHPHRRWERALFDHLRADGFVLAGWNALGGGTLVYDLYDPELIAKTRAYLPQWAWQGFARLVGERSVARMHLDWFVGRGLHPVDRWVAHDVGGAGPGRASDHHPIGVRFVTNA